MGSAVATSLQDSPKIGESLVSPKIGESLVSPKIGESLVSFLM